MRHDYHFTDMLPDAVYGVGNNKRYGRMKRKEELPGVEYLFDMEKDLTCGMWVNLVGQQMLKAGAAHVRGDASAATESGRRLNEYRLVYITDGNGSFLTEKDERGRVKVKGGYILWLSPEQWHSYAPGVVSGWTEYYIGFEGMFADNLIRHSLLDGRNHAFDIGYNEELASLFLHAMEVASQKKSGCQSHLSGIVFHMLGLILSLLKEQADTCCTTRQKMEQAKIIIKENIASSNLDLKQVALSLGLSYSYFRKLFKDYTGVAPGRYIVDLKIDRVKHLLTSTELSVMELLYMSGYNTTENFYRTFKKCTGYTPVEYRRQMMGG